MPGKTTGLRELPRRNTLSEWENEVLRRAAAYLSQSNLPSRSLDGARTKPGQVMRDLVASFCSTKVK